MISTAVSPALSRPQPIGIFPFPAGLLLLPAVDDDLGARRELMRGALPEKLPQAWEFFARAVRGDVDGASAMLRDDAAGVGEVSGAVAGALAGALASYNQFVLVGDEDALQRALQAEDAAVAQLAAVAAFVQGVRDDLPFTEALDGELLAVLHMADAARCLEQDSEAIALDRLETAVGLARTTSPLLAAQLLGQAAQLTESRDATRAITLWRQAVSLAGDSPLAGVRAELLLGLGLALHAVAGDRRGALTEVVQTYQSALHAGISLESAPDTYAMVQSNIGLAYVAMPMTEAGDKLRHAVAVQSFREALKVFTRETHAEQWTSTMLNMANALQYVDSGHREENLILAVETYEQLLDTRNKAYDPAGYARLLANQANALSHLGMFAPALEKFNEAYKLLHWHGEGELAQSILEQVARINAQLGAASPEAAVDLTVG